MTRRALLAPGRGGVRGGLFSRVLWISELTEGNVLSRSLDTRLHAIFIDEIGFERKTRAKHFVCAIFRNGFPPKARLEFSSSKTRPPPQHSRNG